MDYAHMLTINPFTHFISFKVALHSYLQIIQKRDFFPKKNTYPFEDLLMS